MIDIGLTICNILLSATLIPQIWYNIKQGYSENTLSTSISNTCVLITMAFLLAKQGLNITPVCVIMCAALWAILAYQRFKTIRIA